MTRISILVPVCNVETYLKQCMDSIIAQTYENLEIICIDDGSTDSSGEILDVYAQKDARIKVIHKPNAGYGQSMNMGLDMATGEYVGIVESDDYVAPDTYEKLATIVHANPGVDVVKADHVETFYGKLKKQNLFDLSACNHRIKAEDYPQIFSNPCNIWSAIYRKSFLLENDIRFLETPGASYQDVSFYFKTMVKAEAIYLTDEAYYTYRIDNDNSSVRSDKKVFCVSEELEEIKAYFHARGEFTDRVKRFYYPWMFRVNLWNYHRLPYATRPTFWGVFLKDLMEMQEDVCFEEKYWSPENWKLANKILEDTEAYFKQTMYPVIANQRYFGTVKEDIYVAGIIPYLREQETFYLYGAGKIANRVYDFLERENLADKIKGFIVTSMEGNPVTLHGKKVMAFNQISDGEKDILVVMALAESGQDKVQGILQRSGYKKVMRLDYYFFEKMKTE